MISNNFIEIHFIKGTSFAAPTELEKDIQAGKITIEA